MTATTYEQMLRLANEQYVESLVAVHAALDDTLGRDHRTIDDSAAQSIRRLAVEAERRGEVNALLWAATNLAKFPTPEVQEIVDALRDDARRIESGEVTL